MPRLRTSKGKEVTPEMVSALAAEAEAGYDPATLRPRPLGGRPSLGTGGESPRLQFRVSPELHRKAQARARAENRSLSDVARELLEDYTRRDADPELAARARPESGRLQRLSRKAAAKPAKSAGALSKRQLRQTSE